MDDCEPALTELSRTLFCAGFRIWKKRKLLIDRYWQETALENWKKPQKPTQQSKKGKAEEGKQDQLQKPLPLSAETCELFIAAANQMSLLECQNTS